MPSFQQRVKDNQIVIHVDVTRDSVSPAYRRYNALFDTGATSTLVSPRVIEDLNLVVIRPASLAVASGQTVRTFAYNAGVYIPISHNVVGSSNPGQFLFGKDLTVLGLTYQPADYDIILGMDIIGIFHITIYNNVITISN